MATHASDLQNPDIVAAVETATRGDLRPLFALLPRQSHMPGPRPNEGLARALALALLHRGAVGDGIASSLADVDAEAAPSGTSAEFLPYCGTYALAARWKAAGAGASVALEHLESLSEDPRRIVREAVTSALAWAAGDDAARLLDEVRTWMDGYLQATSVLALVSRRTILDRLPEPSLAIERVGQALRLLDEAPRAHQRSHGYRALGRALSDTIGFLLARYGDPVATWIEERIVPIAVTPPSTKGRGTRPTPPLGVDARQVLEESIDVARRAGGKEAPHARVADALAKTAPERRDPKTYVGPTRQRSERSSSRARRSSRR